MIRSPSKGKIFFSPLKAQTVSGATPVSYVIGREGSFFKATRPRGGPTAQVKNDFEFTPLLSAFLARTGLTLLNGSLNEIITMCLKFN